ncbi:MAG: DUF2971 domain-containing protein, partial [Candidatus Marinimicrobia bacterium]|nr:DUF2971 domain-containing protein [Candidatus Neomarinimicrobiota bacterium]
MRLNFDESELICSLYDEYADLVEAGEPRALKHPVLSALFKRLCMLDVAERKVIAEEYRDKDKAAPTEGQIRALEGIKQMWRETVPKTRVLCLSERNDVTAMWNHYADSYSGVVLQFEAVDAVDSALLMVRPVVYQDRAPAIADAKVWARCLLGTSEVRYEDLLTELQYVKTTDWSYEKEWRVVSMARPGETGITADYGFQPLELAGVCFGTRCAKEDRDDLSTLLSHGLEHVRLSEAVKDDKAAKFKIVPISG